ncbi:MAG TPA: TonB-dependent receptor [Steroidobacteraceae bacterium]|jgi:iron complex outermembrane receptor protein
MLKSKQRTLLSCAISGVLGLGGSAAALAQETSRTSVLEEVIVTAEKRAVSIQEVPVAVSAYTSETRTLLGVNTVEDLARFTPSVAYRNDDRLAIRGVGRLTNAVGTDPAVALYSDGIFSTSMADTSTPPLFIERTEILRGPQGTLYGRNSVGGAINVISKRPTDKFEGEVRLQGGNYSFYHADALVRGPITDNLRYLFGAYKENRDDGFIKNLGPAKDGATSDRWMVEGQIEMDLGENAVARLRYSKFEWDDTYGVGNTLLSPISPFDTVLPYNATNGLYYNTTFGYTGINPATNDPYTSNTNRTVVGTLEDHNRIHLDFTWDLGGATLKYFGGYQEYLYHTGSDSDQTPQTAPINIAVPAGGTNQFVDLFIDPTFSVDFDGAGPTPALEFARPGYTATGITTDLEGWYEEHQRWWSNEINISSNGDGAVQWIAGLYQYNTTWNNPQHTTAHGDNTLLVPADGSRENPEGWNGAINGHLEGESYAGFGQIDWTFAPTWTLTLGARYTKDKKEGFDEAWYVGRNPGTAIGAAEASFEAAFRNTLATNPALAPFAALANAPDAVLYDAITTNPATSPFLLPTAQAVAAGVLAVTQGLSLDVTQAATGCVGCVPGPNGGLRRNLKGDWDGVTATAGVQWRPNDDTNVYLRYARGYKAGGFIASANMAPGVYADPEYLNSYELGWKQTVAGRLQLGTAVFFYDYKDFQAPLSVQLPSVGGGSFFATQFLNLDAESKGVEVEAQWSPIDPIRLFVNASYLDTEITRGCCFQDTTDPLGTAPGAQVVDPLTGAQTLKGNSLPNAPKWKYTLGANYTFNWTPGSLTFGGTYSFTDDLQSNVFSNPNATADSNEITDFRILWNDAQNRYTVIGFVKNAFDEVGYIRSSGSAPTAVGSRRTVGLIYPRTYGAEVQFRF